jgi:hypothetical protein
VVDKERAGPTKLSRSRRLFVIWIAGDGGSGIGLKHFGQLGLLFLSNTYMRHLGQTAVAMVDSLSFAEEELWPEASIFTAEGLLLIVIFCTTGQCQSWSFAQQSSLPRGDGAEGLEANKGGVGRLVSFRSKSRSDP